MLTDRDLIKCLKQLRNDPELGWRSDEEKASARTMLFDRLGISDVAKPHYGLRDYMEYIWLDYINPLMRPAMVGVGMFVLIVGGWMTSVSAASSSLPGDMLYPVKLANEQAKLTFTTNDEKKAELHVQFAGNRLSEAKAISNSNREGKEAQMKTAVDAFKSEVGEAKSAMETIVTAGEDATAVATALNETAEAFAGAVVAMGVQAEEAQGEVTEVAEAAVDVLVTTVENNPEHLVKEDLQETFQSRLAMIDSHVKLTLGRITVIETKATEGFILPRGIDLTSLENVLQSFEGQINDAMNAMALGGVRKAFETLDTIEIVIDRTEADVVVLELMIIAQKDGSVDLPPLE